jgi:hypothetical protein
MSPFGGTNTGAFAFSTLSVLTGCADNFDSDRGDLRLVVGEQKAESVVSSEALARASPIFRRMLNGNFAESKPKSGDWVVTLPEDDPYALCFLLNIIHLRFDRIPAVGGATTYTDQVVYKLTVLSDKYELTHSLRPWASSWLADISKRHRRDFTSRIWIAWELGDYKLFAAEVDNLYLNTGVDSDGNLLDATGTRLDTCPMLENLDVLGKSCSHPNHCRASHQVHGADLLYRTDLRRKAKAYQSSFGPLQQAFAGPSSLRRLRRSPLQTGCANISNTSP